MEAPRDPRIYGISCRFRGSQTPICGFLKMMHSISRVPRIRALVSLVSLDLYLK